MKRSMKAICLLAALLLTMMGAAALADSDAQWYSSELYGYGQFAHYAGGYDGYASVDGFGAEYGVKPTVTVISKSASIWAEPRTNSKKLASASNAETFACQTYDGYNYIEQDGFYAVDYKGKEGWVNETYVVLNAMQITLMESKGPAYSAPDSQSKKVGSLSKQTSYTVIGIYDDYYIINLRGAAAAFIPMDARQYDSIFDESYRSGGARGRITVTYKTSMRTGPSDSYAEISKVSSGKQMNVYDIINGWYLVMDEKSGCWGFIDTGDAVDDCFGYDGDIGNG